MNVELTQEEARIVMQALNQYAHAEAKVALDLRVPNTVAPKIAAISYKLGVSIGQEWLEKSLDRKSDDQVKTQPSVLPE